MNSSPDSARFRTFLSPLHSPARAGWLGKRARWLLLALFLWVLPARGQTIYYLTEDERLLTSNVNTPGVFTDSKNISGILIGDVLVGMDVRPQNQQLYVLGVNATANTYTLYHLSPQTGWAQFVGASAGFTTNGTTPVDLPASGYDIDFNPAADRLRVVTSTGLSFRINPNTGGPFDGDNGGASTTGINPDGAINGTSGTGLNGVAYTNNQPNNGNVTTLYTVSVETLSMYIQNPPNGGTQIQQVPVLFQGDSLRFSEVSFDIAPGVNATATNAAVIAGSGFMAAKVDGAWGMYRVDLVSGQATALGNIPVGLRSFCIRTDLGSALALAADGNALFRFSPETPGTVTTQGVGSIAGGETLVGIAARPQTGQVFGLGVNATADTATLYIVDPQTGAMTAVGTAGSIAFVKANGTPEDLPDPATVKYGMDFNPATDRLRVVNEMGQSFRIVPTSGAAVDGNLNNGTPTGVNMDGPLNGAATGAVATAYTNSFGQVLTGGATTQYTIDAASDSLLIQNPPNAGTLTQQRAITVRGAAVDFSSRLALDIPDAVAVTTSNTPATGFGWMVGTMNAVTRLYRLNLETAEAEPLQLLGTGSLPVAGFVMWTSRTFLENDQVVSTGPATRYYPLGNDGLDDGYAITSVSNPAVIVDGRSLIIPAGFTGTFTYTVSKGAFSGQATVTVTLGAQVVAPKAFNGLVFAEDGAIVGWANAAISAKGVATLRILGGANAVSAKATFATGQNTAAVFSKLGQLTLTKNANGTVGMSIDALGGGLAAVLRAAQTAVVPGLHNIALASIDAEFPGGGFATAKVAKTGAVAIVGVLPDGLPFTASSALADNGTVTFFSVVKGAKPPAVVGGQLTTADLPKTDVTGELYYSKLPQLKGAAGTHLGGVETVLTARGSLFEGTVGLTGPGTLTISGGGLAVPEVNAVMVSTKGAPAVPTGSLKGWTVTSKTAGTFSAKVLAPDIAKPVAGKGIYLRKTAEAWGYFPGKTEGGRIELKVPQS